MAETTIIEVVDTAVKIGLGAFVSGIATYFAVTGREKLVLEREKLARKENQEFDFKKKKAEFQFDTVVALQDVLTSFLRLNARAYLADRKAYRANEKWGRDALPDDISPNLFEKRHELNKLKCRLQDVQLREIVEKIIDTYENYDQVEDHMQAAGYMNILRDLGESAFDRIQTIFDKLYE